MAEPTYDPYGVVLVVMKDARTGVKSRFEGHQMASAVRVACDLLIAFDVTPVLTADYPNEPGSATPLTGPTYGGNTAVEGASATHRGSADSRCTPGVLNHAVRAVRRGSTPLPAEGVR
ncbi:hypothetical protein [Sphaerisporangium aureirubrum]|uniref:Uncharacterized protein n=1 Tax=Sphaerisporangium aureirubrum TaxID=1544736 RepID=A0ABW1NCP7_9ACTN